MGKKSYHVVEIGSGDQAVTVLTALNANPLFTTIYRNSNTRTLDRTFNLDNTVIVPGSYRQSRLHQAVQLSALGDTFVERLLRYFVELAQIYLVFVGLPEQELKIKIENNYQGLQSKRGINCRSIDLALAHQDPVEINGVIQLVPYLKKASVKGIEVLFPANLR